MIELYNCPACNSKVFLAEHHFSDRGVHECRECISTICRGCFRTYDYNDNKLDVSEPECFKIANVGSIHCSEDNYKNYSEYQAKISEIAIKLKKQWNAEVELFIDNKTEEYRRSIEEFSSLVPLANKQSDKSHGRL